MRRAPATAKINLALVVGPRRADGRHEVATVLQRVALSDRISLESTDAFRVTGFSGDTLVVEALRRLAAAAEAEPRWAVRITKRIPVAAGLGGGSSDAATALRLANETLERPLEANELAGVARAVGADVPFFLADGPQLGSGEGAELEPLELPQDYWVVLVLPHSQAKSSTADVYADFDTRGDALGWEERREELTRALGSIRRAGDLALLPPNDLASRRAGAPLAVELRALGAFRADVSGAGPAVYGLFTRRAPALAARRKLTAAGRTWLTVPAWYG